MSPSSSTRPHTPAQLRLCATYRNLMLWTLQGWIAMFFIAAGYAKLTEPMTNLVALMGWPALAADSFVRSLGGVEVALAVMLLAPLLSWRFGRGPMLVAAGGLLTLETVMLGVHLLDFDAGRAATNLALIAITAPVLWMRSREHRPA